MKRNYLNKKILFVLMLILTIFMGTLINVDAEINDSDDEKMLIEDYSTIEVPASFSFNSSNGRSTFFKDGVVTAANERKKVYSLYYYGKDGKLLKKAELPDAYIVYYVKSNDDYLYVISYNLGSEFGYCLSKLDENLNVVAKINFEVDVLYLSEDPFQYDSSCGVDFLNFTNENILMYAYGYIYIIDYNLENIECLKYTEIDGYIEKYFPSMKLDYVTVDEASFESNNVFAETKKGKFNLYSFSNSSVGTIFADRYVNNKLVRKEIKNEDYRIFSRTKVIDDYIVTVGGKQKDEIASDSDWDSFDYSYISDIVVYNLDGELVQTVPVDKVVNYLSVSDDKVSFSTQVYDGICTYDKYTNDAVGCDILSSVSTYSLVEKRYVDSAGNKIENNSPVTIKNPQTASTIVFVTFILCLTAFGVSAIFISGKLCKKR